MEYVPKLASAHVPDGDAIFATAWQTVQPVLEFPASKGAKFYLIQHYETWAGAQEIVDATWRLPLHKIVIARWLLEKGVDLGCSRESMAYIPNGMAHDVFTVSTPIDERPLRVSMMYSEHQEWKGSTEGVVALNIAKAAVPRMQAVLFGTHPRPQNLPGWIEYRQKPPQKELVQEIYNGSSIFVCSSWYEGSPLPPAEAMSCGCALVSTDIGGIADYAEDEATALLSPAREPEALSRNIIRFLTDEALRQRIARAGHDRIKQFTWQRSTGLLEIHIRKYLPSYQDPRKDGSQTQLSALARPAGSSFP
jgi:L-malate glycosyltransferase